MMKQGPRVLRVDRMLRASRCCTRGSGLLDWATRVIASQPRRLITSVSRLIQIQGRRISQRRSASGS